VAFHNSTAMSACPWSGVFVQTGMTSRKMCMPNYS